MSESKFRTVEKLTSKPARETVIDLPENGALATYSSTVEVSSSSSEYGQDCEPNQSTHHITGASREPAIGSMAAFQTMSSFYRNEKGKQRGTTLLQALLFCATFFIFSANFQTLGMFFGGAEPNPPFAITITILALFIAISAYLKSTATRAESKIKTTLGKLRPNNQYTARPEHPEHYVKNAAQYIVTFSKIDSTLKLLQHSLIYVLTVLAAIWTVFAIHISVSRFESIAFAITCLLVAGIIQIILRMDFFGYDEDVKKLLRTIENDSKYSAVLHWARIPAEDQEQRKVVQISHAEFEELPPAISLNLLRLILMYGLAAFFTGLLNMVFAERFLSKPISDVFTLTVITSVLSLPIIVSSYKRLRFPLELRKRYLLHQRLLLIIVLVGAFMVFASPVFAMSEVLANQYGVEPPIGLMLAQVGITAIIPFCLAVLESTRFAHAANKILRGTLTPYTSLVTLPWRADRPIRLSTIPRGFAQDILDIKKQLSAHIVDKEATMRPLIT
ncbi:hypothetical protein [Corynebacterium freiburgense]|uniref:hypothetical protein n=1 Tax=Corynebacterium freiburgense TaxID=556548 RepID=UPI0004118D0A|nr:hypothetical protein [Corynebacterium freiburgense]WJZ02060.1 hypothetical protein CFREI_03805 [Corynebacterium freiburgense]